MNDLEVILRSFYYCGLNLIAFTVHNPNQIQNSNTVNGMPFPMFVFILIFFVLEPIWNSLCVCFPGVTTHCDCIFHSLVAGFSLLVFEVSWSRTTTRHSRQDSSGRVMNPSQRPLPDNTQHSQQTNIHAPVGFEPKISAEGRPKFRTRHDSSSSYRVLIQLLLLFLI